MRWTLAAMKRADMAPPGDMPNPLRLSPVVGRYVLPDGSFVAVAGAATDEGGDPSTDPAADDLTTDPEPPAADTATSDELAKWKALARKHEKQAKAAAEKLARQQMDADEQKAAEARDEGYATGIAAGAKRVAAAEIKAALTGIAPDPASIVEDLDLSKFLDDDHEVDADKVSTLVEKYRAIAKPDAKADGNPPPPPSVKPPRQPDGGGNTTPEDRAKARRERMFPNRKSAA